MRFAGLSYYVCQRKPESEVAPGRSRVPEVASLILSGGSSFWTRWLEPQNEPAQSAFNGRMEGSE